jgi:hypothetical protein
VIITINEKNAHLYNALFAKAYQALDAVGKVREDAVNEEGRFLSLDDYFAHMADLLSLDSTYMMLPLDESPFAINANSRSIAAPRIVALQKDQIAETVIFTIDRYFDHMDLNNATIYVQWTLPSGKEGATHIELIDTDFLPEKIRFGWPLDDEITSEVGQVKYSVRFWNKGTVKENGSDVEKVVYSFNTLTSTLTISPSLQPEINPDLEINAPVRENLFKRAVRNSVITGQGTPVPLSPIFGEPGLDLPIYASLADNTLTLKAQAVASDTGAISYEWYYAPAETETIDGKEFVAGVFYPFNDEVEGEGEDAVVVTNGFSAYGGTVNHNHFEKVDYTNGLVIGEKYYVIADGTPLGYEAYTSNAAPTDGTELYQRFTTYTVPVGEGKNDTKVTGEYYVHAVNSIRTNSTVPQPSQICRLVSPDGVEYVDDLNGVTIIPASGSANLTVRVNQQASPDAAVSYAWVKDTTSNAFAEDEVETVSTTTVGNIEVTTPGWYRVTTSALLNRETKSAISAISKVTFDPVIPTMTYNEATQALIPAGDTIPNITSDENVVLEVVVGNVVPAAYEDYATELFSEKLDFVWKVQVSDGPERVLGQADIDSGFVIGELGQRTLTVNAAGRTAYIFTCEVTNTLNGKVVTSDETNSLSFLVV